MNTQDKHLDKKFLAYHYQGKVSEIKKGFTTFLSNIPEDIDEIMESLNHDNITKAKDKIQQVIPMFLSIGLPLLSVQLQTIEVYLNYANISKSKILMNIFIQELADYIPVIKDEYRRLIEGSIYQRSHTMELELV